MIARVAAPTVAIDFSNVPNDALKSMRSASSSGTNGVVDALFQIAFGEPAQAGGDLIDGGDAAGDVGGELDDFRHFAVEIEYWIVGSLDPDLASAFADALEFGGDEFAAFQFRPEFLVFGAASVSRLDEYAMMLAAESPPGNSPSP